MEHEIIFVDQNKNEISKLFFQKEESLLSLCQKASIIIPHDCMGKGICGRCQVRFVKGAPLPQAVEKKVLAPDKLRQGFRLACLTKVKSSCVVMILEMEVVQVVLHNEELEWLDLEQKEGSFVAIDIGTTTIAMEKRKIAIGKRIKSYCSINSGRKYGQDVISRIEAANEGKLEELKKLLDTDLKAGIEDLVKEDIKFVVISANTAMQHILFGYPMEGLGISPYTPYALAEEHFYLDGIKAIAIKGYSAFIGGDIAAGLVAFPPEDKWKMLIDLGTNAEIVLYSDKKSYATSAAAGPAFDLAASLGYFATDMVQILARMLDEKVIDTTGLLQDKCFENGYTYQHLHITTEQIRSIQTAKAAVYAGIQTMLKRAGLTENDVETVYIAGGFGYYLDIKSAIRIGLLPKAFSNKTIACGNSALYGAVKYAENMIFHKVNQNVISPQIIELADSADFHSFYLKNLDFIQ